MKNVLKKFVSCVSALIMGTTILGTNVYADDIRVNLDRARETYGGGCAITLYSAATGERRDTNNYEFTWFNEDSKIIVDYTYNGTYEEAPIKLVMQTWIGDKVESDTDASISVLPTEFTDTQAIWDMATIDAAWEYPLEWVYALNFYDTDNCGIKIDKVMFSNLDIPKERILKLTGGIVLRDGVLITEDNIDAPVTEAPVEEPVVDESEATVSESAEEDAEETEASESEVSEASDKTTSEKPAEESSNSVLVIALIALGVLSAILVIVLIVRGVRGKNKGWH